jgi:hypothetical protein
MQPDIRFFFLRGVKDTPIPFPSTNSKEALRLLFGDCQHLL